MNKPTTQDIQERHNAETAGGYHHFEVVNNVQGKLQKRIDSGRLLVDIDRGILLKRLEGTASERDKYYDQAALYHSKLEAAEKRVTFHMVANMTLRVRAEKAEQTIKDVQTHLNLCTGDAINEIQAIIGASDEYLNSQITNKCC